MAFGKKSELTGDGEMAQPENNDADLGCAMCSVTQGIIDQLLEDGDDS